MPVKVQLNIFRGKFLIKHRINTLDGYHIFIQASGPLLTFDFALMTIMCLEPELLTN